jgi:hypothetical protein
MVGSGKKFGNLSLKLSTNNGLDKSENEILIEHRGSTKGYGRPGESRYLGGSAKTD